MKTIFISIVGLLLITSNVFSDGLEMTVKISSPSATGWEINWISVKQISIGFVHYDGRLRPMTEESQYSSPQKLGTEMILGAAYNDNTNPLVDGVFGYGLYYVLIKKDNIPKGACYIDTRDCNYGYDSLGVRANNDDGYYIQDFDLKFTHNPTGPGTFTFGLRNYSGKDTPGTGNDTIHLWDAAEKPRSTKLFQNFRLSINSPHFVEVKIGNATYSVNSAGILQLPLDVSTTTIKVQNRKLLFPPPLPDFYVNFSSWENGIKFDTVRTIKPR